MRCGCCCGGGGGAALAQSDATTSPAPASQALDSANGAARAIWSDGTTIWVTNLGGHIYAYNLADMTRDAAKDISTLRAGNHNANGMWSDGQTMWVSDDVDDKIYAYDLASGSRQTSLELNTLKGAGNYHPKGLWSDGTTIWVSDHSENKLYAYSLHTAERIPNRDIDAEIYVVTNAEAYAILADSTGTLMAKHRLSIATADNHRAAALWSDGLTMWVSDDSDGKLYAYDLDTGVRRADLDFDSLQGAGNASPKGIWSDGAAMWVADNGDRALYRYSMPQSAALRSLELSDVDLGLFAVGRFSYEVRVPNTVTTTTVRATAAFPDETTVTISPDDADTGTDGHQVSLSAGINTITVTAVNGADTRTYTVNINELQTAKLTSNASLESLALADGDMGSFDSAVGSYVVSVAESVSRTTITASASEPAADVSISPDDADPVADGHQIDLNAGANIVTVTVTSTDGRGYSIYRVQVNRASTADFGWDSLSDFNAVSASDEGTLWSDGTTLWVADFHDAKVYAYDVGTRERVPAKDVDTLRAAGNSHPSGIWSDGNTVWIADYQDSKVYAYDLDTGLRLPNADVDALIDAGNGQPVGVWSDGATMWVGDFGDTKVYAYDLRTGERDSGKDLNTLRQADNSFLVDMWSDGTTMWVGDYLYGKIFAYDLRTGARKNTLDFHSTLQAAEPAGLWSDGATMWVYDSGKGKTFAYNLPETPLLGSLSLEGIDIGVFNVGRTHYLAYVPSTVASTTVAASAKFDGSTVAISPATDADSGTDGHQVDLSTGANTITATVTDGTDTTTYTITVIRSSAATLSDVASLSGLSLSGVDLGAFDSATTSYSARVDSALASTTITATPTDPAAAVTVDPATDIDPDAEGLQISLDPGANVITVAVESSDGTNRRSYQVTVTRPAALDWGALPASLALATGNSAARAIWSDGATMWVLNRGSRIYAYNLADMTRDADRDITTLRAAGNRHPSGMWSDGATLWVVDDVDDKIYAYNLHSGERITASDINTLKGANNNYPTGLWSDGATLWVADNGRDKIYAYDLRTGTRQAGRDIGRLGGGAFLRSGNSRPAALWSDGDTMWVADDEDGKVYAYDRRTSAHRAEFDLDGLGGAGNDSPWGIWSDGTAMWVVDSDDSHLYAYDMPDNPRLESLGLDPADIGALQRERTDYTARVPNTVASVTVDPTTVDESATVAISPSTDADSEAEGHQVELSLGENVITVTVTSGSLTRTYTATVIQVDAAVLSDDASLSELSLSGIDLGAFDSDTTEYSATVGSSVASTTVAATATDPAATVAVDPADDADPGTDGRQVNLGTGINAIAVTVESSDGTTRRSYQVNVVRAAAEAVDWGPVPASKALASANGSARAIWSDGITMWVMNVGDRIFAYSLADMTRDEDKDIATIRAAGNRHGNGMWSDGTTMWVSDDDDLRIYAYDLATGARRAGSDITTLRSVSNAHPKGLWSDGDTMWVADHHDDKIYAYDLATGARRAGSDITTLEDAGNGRAAGMWSDGDTMWVADDDDGKVYAYDLATGAHKPDLDVDALAGEGNDSPKGIWSNGSIMWVSDNDDDLLYAYDLPFNARLESLGLDPADVGPLDSVRTEYGARVPNTVTSVTVSPTTADDRATFTISPSIDADPDTDGHQVDLSAGANTITVTVTKDSTVRVYSVTVIQVDAAVLSDDASLSGLSLSGVDFGVFDGDTTGYSATVGFGVASATLAAVPADPAAEVTVVVPAVDADTDADGHQVSLDPGANTITVLVESSDGTDTRSYRVDVTRATAEAFEWVVLPGVKELAEGNSSPRGVWSDGTTLWVSNRGDRIYAYDFASMSRDVAKDITAIEAAGNRHASGLWSDGATMWVSDEDDGKVYAYDLATGARVPGRDIDTKDEAGNARPKGIWSDGETMWVGDYDDFHVYAYDLDTGERVAIDYVSLLGSGTCYCRDIEELPYDHNHHPVGLWSDGDTMWVSDSADDKVYAYGLTDYTNDPRYEDSEFNSLRAAGNTNPEGMWSDGAVLWVVDSKDNLLYGYNMPATVSLSSLEITDADFGVFHPSILRYAARVPTTVTSVTITADAADADTTVAISPSTDADPDTDGHQIALSAGANTITVTVTKDSTVRVYSVTVIQVDAAVLSDDASLSGLSLSGVDFGVFDGDTTGYSATVGFGVVSATLAAVPADPAAEVTVVVPAVDADAGADGHQVSLDPGANTITVLVESSDGTDTRTYRVDVTRATAEAFEWVVLPGVKELAEGNSSARGVWSDGTTLWVSNRGDRVYAYDFASMSRDATKDITAIEAAGNHHASGLWSDGATMWVSDEDDGKVYAYDLATDARVPGSDIDTKDEAGNARPKGIWSDGETMWVGDYDDFHVYAYDLDTGERVAIDYVSLLGSGTCYCRDIEELPYDHNHHPVGLWSDGDTMWVSDSADDKVYAYGLTDYTNDPRYEDSEFNSLRAAGNTNPEGMWSDGAVLWVVDSKDNLLYGYNMPATVSLSSLEITDADFGVFHPSILRYAARVPTTVTEVTITAEADDTDTTVAINPSTDADPDTDGHQIALSAGANTITVTATKGTDTRTYTITIISGDVVAVAGEAVAGEAVVEEAVVGEAVVEEAVAEGADEVLVETWVALGPANRAARAIWSDGTTMWVVNLGGHIYAYDLADMSRDASKDINALGEAGNHNANGMWSDGTTLWVSDDADDKIYAYDLYTGARAPSSDISGLAGGGNDHPKGLWSDGTTIWVADHHDDKIYAYDLATGSRDISRDISGLGAAGNGRAAALWSNGTTMWVGDDADGKIFAYDLATGARRADLDINSLQAAGNSSPKGIWSNGTTMWVSDNHDRRVYDYNMPATAQQ